MTDNDAQDFSGSTRALLDAVVAISSDLDLRSVLSRIVVSAAELTAAEFGALGVIGPEGDLVEFITTGIDPDERERIGDPPHGRGILGLLIRHPEPLRLQDLTTHPESYGFPPHHPPMRSFLGVPVRIRGTVFGNLYLTQKQGEAQFTLQDVQLVEALATAAGFVIENARAYGLSERRRQWLEASAELAELLQPPVEIDRALRQITSAARSVSRARATAVVNLVEGKPVRTVAVDPDEQELVSAALDEIGVVDLEADAPPLELSVGGMYAVVIPLRAHLAGRGVLVALFDHAYGAQDLEERELLVSFADQAALALDRARAVADRAELAVISDRERIARDLHDVVIQRLFATGLQLQGAAMLTTNPDAAARIDKAVNDLDLTIKDIRGTIFELQNRQAGSLRAELRSLVAEYAEVLGFTPTVRTSGPVDTVVPVEIREQLLPVLREALSNVARHASADSADVQLHIVEGALVLSVLDDGVGIADRRRESGLRNARRRATAHGGTLEITSRAPRGTSFVWRVPVP